MNYKDRRLARVAITFPFLFEIMEAGWKTRPGEQIECIKGLPKGAVFIRSYVDESEQMAYLIFFHESFLPVSEGVVIPLIRIIHSEHNL